MGKVAQIRASCRLLERGGIDRKLRYVTGIAQEAQGIVSLGIDASEDRPMRPHACGLLLYHMRRNALRTQQILHTPELVGIMDAC